VNAAARRSTWAWVLTPAGRGAVATVRVEGPEAAALVDRLFEPASQVALAEQPADRIVFGRWSTTGEDLVVCRREPEAIEIHCHGGSAAVASIIATLAEHGCATLDWRAGLARNMPRSLETQALELACQARTQRTASILLEQQSGALRRELQRIIEQLASGEAAAAHTGLNVLLARGRLGLHLVEPFRIALAGPVNVGKSSLLNALVGYHRAIVSHEPGTTRDIVTATTAIGGWPIELRDTAGLRETDETLECEGIRRARAELADADLVLLVSDASVLAIAPMLPADLPEDHILSVVNKSDLLASDQLPLPAEPVIRVSARTGEGLDRLLDEIEGRVVGEGLPPGAGLPFMPEHVAALRTTTEALATGDLARALTTLNGLLVVQPAAE